MDLKPLGFAGVITINVASGILTIESLSIILNNIEHLVILVIQSITLAITIDGFNILGDQCHDIMENTFNHNSKPNEVQALYSLSTGGAL